MTASKLFTTLTATLVLLLLGVSGTLKAQNTEKNLRKADYFYGENNLVEAEDLYKVVLNDDPSNYKASYRLGLINSYLQDYREALRFFRQASEIDPARNDTVYMQIGLSYKRLNNYRKAREAFEEFMNRHTTRDELFERAEREIAGCDLAEESLLKEPSYRVRGVSFNSSARDQFPAFLDQRQEDVFIAFTSHRPLPKKKAKRDPSTGEPKDSDIFYVVMENDSTFAAETDRFSKIINKKKNEGAATFTADGLTMFFTICNGKKNKNGCSIFESKYNPIKKAWGKPVLVEGLSGTKEVIVNARGKTKQVPTDDRQPVVSRDGRTIFFVSDRGGGEGGFDIWFSRKLGKGWSQPTNAGATVNTPFNELTPFLNSTATALYFASDGLGGFGGYDLYKVEGSVGSWGDAVNMGSPINSSYNDYGSYWMPGDTTMLFTSNRPGGMGSDDIYWSRFIPFDPGNLNVSVHGIIRDKKTQQPIEFATAILYEYQPDNSIIALDTFKTDQSARYEFPLEVEKRYKVLGNAPEYLANEEEFNTEGIETNTDLEKNIDIELEPISLDSIFTLQNVYYDFDEFFIREDAQIELNKLVKLMRQNDNITIILESHTDSNGTPDYNVNLSNNRAKAVVKYLALNGIDPGRLAWFGYGETQLMVYPELSDEDEQANRRTEFRITSIEFGQPN
ncbi:MAG: OmpA family protein [Bacteroidota bacterium]